MDRIGEDAIKRDKRGAQSKRNRINEDITGTEVRLIGSDGEQVGIVALEEALQKAQGESLDLVEIAVDSEPPVCRIMDYGKHIFDEKKSRAEAKKKQKKTQVKEIKF
ncbi:MAG: translation initiation factor IF-3, partial [Pseudomonadales bacterium]|nr:translation initiation factor IF-3 [Pseudomonadales bacterium]